MTYARDTDIGKKTTETQDVEVQNLASIVTALEEATAKVEEAIAELEKITMGTGFVTGTDLSNVEVK